MSTNSPKTPLLANAGKDDPKAPMADQQIKVASDDENDANKVAEASTAEPQQGRSPIVSLLISFVFIGLNVGISFATETYYECAVSFGVNIISFICIAWPLHTEKYYDFTGMLTFLSIDIFSIIYHKVPWNLDHIRNIVLFFFVMFWTLRLGIFLFKRISNASHGGRDKRFDELRDNFARFSVAWVLQATWGYFCCMPLLIANQIDNDSVHKQGVANVTPLDIVGWSLWVFGWAFEIIADRQKTVFKNDPNNRGKFCNVGLWKLSRHPNYFGEITLWMGIFVSGASVARDAGWLIVLSPLWTIVLLVFSSGIPLAERTALKKYGHLEEYQEYIKKVSVLIPLPCCWKGYI